MYRSVMILVLLVGSCLTALADHITGGEIYYKFVGLNSGLYEYDVSVRIFMRCNSGRQFVNPAAFSIFYASTSVKYRDYNVRLDRVETLSEKSNDPCIVNPPTVCYEVGYYEFRISVPTSASMIIAHQVLYRIDGISNLTPNYDQVGATYISELPAIQNNSAHFTGSDLVTICANNEFQYSFAAEDADGDELNYYFCDAYGTSAQGGFGSRSEPPPPPPYKRVPYGQGFNGTQPLGGNVKIDSKTGLITGIAPAAGKYIVTVCVSEMRNGQVIATQHKDLQINITPCSITGASLPPEYMLCGTTMTLSPKNLSTSPLISTYTWEFFNANGNNLFSSDDAEPNYTFADTGLYQVRLTVNRDKSCSDSASALVRVYPGFQPDFSVSGPCIVRATQFNDASTSALGTVTAWLWNFGDGSSSENYSTIQNPQHQYGAVGDKLITLVAENSLGCVDTVSKTVNVYTKPPIGLAFRDTLICPPDNLQLQASGEGNYTWTSPGSLSDPTVADPFVNPLSTTMYYVNLDVDGCVNTDSVKVRVVDHVSVLLGGNPTICEGDTVHLNAESDGTRFSWTPASAVNDATAKNVVSKPASTTTYQLTAYISSCSSSANITVTPVPYPVADAGADTLICYHTNAQLHASTDGSSFVWSPLVKLQGAQSLNPVASPESSTTYIFYAYDTKGCNKPGVDSVTVNVHPPIVAFAGNDTSVVVNQPLALQASGGTVYRWIPSTGLSADDVADPVARYASSPAEGYYTYKVLIANESGCVDSANIRVNVFASEPELYVPNAFTPNNDGHNDFFTLEGPGIQYVKFFRVYNRWGQLVFDSPVSHSRGWDGTYNGKPLSSDTFVWMVQAIDYTGKPIFKRGTVTLIR